MAGPWERYQQPASPSAAPTGGPWERYATAPSKPDFSNVQSGASRVPSEPPRGNAVTRAIGEIGGRQVLQGAAGLYGALGGDALNHYVLDPLDRALFNDGPTMSGLITGQQPQQRSVLGTGGRTYREAASDLADEIGMRAPQTGGERVLSDVGEALTGAGLTMGIGAGANALARMGGAPSSRVGNFLTAQPGLQAVSAGTGAGAAGVTREQGGSQGQQLAAGLIGGLSPGAAGATTGATLRGIVRGRDGAQMQRNIEDFAALGATPSVGQASGNRLVQGAENLLAGGPTSYGVMNRFGQRQADDIGAGVRRQAESLARNPSAERAGDAVRAGVETFKGNVGAQRRALYWQADQFIPANSGAQMQNTLRTLSELTTPATGAQATTARLVNPRMRQMLDDLQADLQANGGQIPYESLRRIRTSIGEQMNDFSMTPDTPARQLSALYGALSRDMEAVAAGIGPEAVRATRRANNYTRLSTNRLQHLQRVVDKEGGGEAIYNAVMQGAKDGGTRLRRVMSSLPQDSQRQLTAAVIRRMGLATPGAQDAAGDVFSARHALTNWNKISPEARRALFDRHGPGFSRDMDRIARVAENIKSGGDVFSNPSGTANRQAAQAYGVGLPLSVAQAPFTGHWWPVVATVGGGIGANLAARALTNPNIVRWLARSTAMPVGSVNASLRQLAEQGERDGDQDVTEFANALLQHQPEESPSQ